MTEKIIRITILRHETEDHLLMAVSGDLRGLMVHGRSIEEIEGRLPSVVRDLLEADGHSVEEVELVREKGVGLSQFGPPAFIANASFRTAA